MSQQASSSRETLTLYRSSAGSGKTYTLTREYLFLALRSGDPRSYRKILAVTFTNKAMKEMKDRIIKKLDDFSSGKLNDPMARELMDSLEWNEDTFRQRCSAMLTEILHNYGNFSITTIDAFFQQIVRSFARELHISGGYRLELEQDLIYHKVIQELLDSADKDDYIRNWVTEFSFSRLEEARGWEVENQLFAFLKELDKESFRSIEDEIRKFDRERFMNLHNLLLRDKTKFENAIGNMARKAVLMAGNAGIEQRDFYSGNAANFIYRLASNDFEKEPGVQFIKCTTGEQSWFSKAKLKDDASKVERLMALGFGEIAEDILNYWNRNSASYMTSREIYNNIYVFALAIDLLRKLAEVKKESDILFISDATTLIRDLVRDTDAPFIYEKVGAFFEHYLIDEFQDTSRFQWDSFRPLVENSLSEGKANLIVGDVKQSIYRWRGGDLQLLQHEVQSEFSGFTPQSRTLDTNFRSHRHIIDFNNHIFSVLPAYLEKQYQSRAPGSLKSVAEELGRIYHDVRQKSARKDAQPAGYIEARFLPREDFMEAACMNVLEIIRALQDKGVPLRDTAILVRNNSEGRRIAEFLMEERQKKENNQYRLDVVSNETLFLASSNAVNCLISALRHMNDPSDELSKAALLFFYNRIHEKGSGSHDFASGEWNEDWNLRLDELQQLRSQSLFTIIEEAIRLFDLGQSPGEFPYLQTFQDHVLSYSRREKGDIAGFLQEWEDRLQKKSIRLADEIDAIRIMTIHKAKGLEFHSVIIPYLDWVISGSRGLSWYPYRHEEGAEVHVPVSFTGRLNNTVFRELYQEDVYSDYLDNLNLLYVAFTRAVHDLWLIAPDEAKKGHIAAVINDLFNDEKGLPAGFQRDEVRFWVGNPGFTYSGEERRADGEFRLERYRFFDWTEKLKLKPVPERSRTEAQKISIALGNLVHDILSKVRVIGDVKRVLDDVRFREGLNEADFDALRAKLKAAFRNPEVSSWFQEGWEVRNECAIFSDGKEYRPDRVIYMEGRTLVIDYKTGKPRKSDREQMSVYLDLVCQLYPGEAEGRILYLEELDIIECK